MGRKILSFFDEHVLKIGIGFLLAFIPLYPKLPLLDVTHTWVYVRFEDVLILIITIIWLIQLFRKKVSFKTPLSIPIFVYWFIGGISLLFSLIFLSTQLANFFPTVAALNYLRRIEYMIPFFITVSTIKSMKDVKDYLIIISLTLLGVVFYGFGQRYLGFPAYLTMNEEFAKGTPFYIPLTGRVTSTFGGHYDLAAFLVLMIAFSGSLIFGLRNIILKIVLFASSFSAFILLLFTASRISFMVYLLAISFMLYLQKKKWFIAPVVLASVLLMLFISGASQRFAETFRIQRVVYNTKTGAPIAILEEPTPPPAKEKTPIPPPPENLPLGSGFLTVPALEKTPEATTVATIRRSIVASLKTASSSSEIATISGDFLIRRTIVYDISFTTRFQGEWPRALEAFKRNPILGSGYSSISLATDNDYLRALGETGVLGLVALLGVFFTAVLVIRRALKSNNSPLERSILIGVGAGLLGLMLNATLIDVFEASKVAFSFWMILGIGVGVASLKKERKDSLFQEMVEIIRLPITPLLLLLASALAVFYSTTGNYFVGNDFTWFRWADTSAQEEILKLFLWADGFFYRPLTKSYFTLLYPILGLKPYIYHLINIFLHLGSAVMIYFISLTLTKKKLIAFLAGLFFIIHPVNAESVLWISSTSGESATFFLFCAFLFYLFWRNKTSRWNFIYFIFNLILFTAGIFSNEVVLVFPLLIFSYDLIFTKKPKSFLFRLIPLLPYFLIMDAYLWLRVGAGAHGLTGDYSYNLKNLLFNFVGNLWGYLGLLIAGEKFIPIYDLARTFLRLHRLWAGIAILLVVILIAVLVVQKKIGIRKWQMNPNFKFFIFASAWLIVGLIPFLGLGNIAERYIYLASFAFVFALAILINIIWENLKKRNQFQALTVVVVIISVISGFYWLGTAKTQDEWTKAGESSNRLLLAISSNYSDFPSDTTIYFVNLPIRQGRAWVFPVGLKDGLWFIYRDDSLKIEKADNVEQALDLAEKNKPSHVFVFENGELKEATRTE